MGTQVVIKTQKSPRKVSQSAKTKMIDVQESRGILPPMWGIVEEAFSEDNTVNVQLQTGLVLRHVAVISKEWGGANNDRGYGEQDLPPKGSEVLVMFPNNLIEEAFVIGSKLETLGEMGEKQSAELLKAGQERKLTRILETGWKLQYDKDTGDLVIENGEVGADKIEVVVNKSDGQVSAKSRGAKIEITNAGIINVVPATGQNIVLNNGIQNCNNLPACLFSGAGHGTNPQVKV